MTKPNVAYYYLADLYGDDYASDTSAEDLDQDEIESLILEDLEQQYGETPIEMEVYIQDNIGEDTEIEVLLDWEE